MALENHSVPKLMLEMLHAAWFIEANNLLFIEDKQGLLAY